MLPQRPPLVAYLEIFYAQGVHAVRLMVGLQADILVSMTWWEDLYCQNHFHCEPLDPAI